VTSRTYSFEARPFPRARGHGKKFHQGTLDQTPDSYVALDSSWNFQDYDCAAHSSKVAMDGVRTLFVQTCHSVIAFKSSLDVLTTFERSTPDDSQKGAIRCTK
jgi:hypothetical protein